MAELTTPKPVEQHEHNGTGGYLTADQIEKNAPADLVEEDVDNVFGGKVRVRSLTAAQSARIQQVGVKMNPSTGRPMGVSVADMEIMQFEVGVIQPKLDHNAVVRLFQQSGPSFKRVCQKIDEISGTDKDEFLRAQEAFQGSEAA